MPVKGKSGKKPLRDVSNHKYARTSSKSVATAKIKENHNRFKVEDQDDALDRLLLVQSDLSALTLQIDELVVKAFELKEMGKHGKKEIESFTNVLSDMLSSLKPWVPRFQKVFSSPSKGSDGDIGQSVPNEKSNVLVNGTESNVIDSPDQAEVQDLVSPSPLVSWRAGCNIDRGRHLFLLTPLPISKSLSSKHVEYSRSVLRGMTSRILKGTQPCFIACGDFNENLLEGNGFEPCVGKPSGSDLTTLGENLLEGNGIASSIGKPSGSGCGLTNLGENLLEGNGIAPGGVEPSGFDFTKAGMAHQRGFPSPPISSKKNCSMIVMTPCLKMSPPKSCVLLEPISEPSHKDKRIYKATPFPMGVRNYSSSSDASDGLALKYPELFGIQQANKSGIRKELEDSPDWFMSPPKTCVLLEPSDSRSVENAACDGCHEAKKSCSHEDPVGVSLPHIDNTPMLKECESVFRVNKRAGEETLKKELWLKFEAASANPFGSDQALQTTSKKGFLDLLDEVSCE